MITKPAYNPEPSPLTASTDPCVFLVGDYNVENMAPTSAHIPTVANHIVQYLKSPDIVFVQEIQDDSGPTDDGVVSANLTLTTLTNAIKAAGGIEYSFIDIPPENDKDGGQPGGNIRQAYLYDSSKLSLVAGSPVGTATQANEVVVDAWGGVGLKYNPGRIDPTNVAWTDSRKPLVAAWQTVSGERFFTVNVHYASKGGSSSSQGDARPPVNGVVTVRQAQVDTTATFLKTLFAADADASVIVSGDMNEYIMTRGVFAGFSGLVYDIDEAAGLPPAERYTYVYDQNTQELDHIFISAAIKNRGVSVEHIHVNTWSPSYKERISDHDPSVAKVAVCTNLQKYTGACERLCSLPLSQYITKLLLILVGGIPAPAVTKKGNKYYVAGNSYSLLAYARTQSCNVQLTKCTAAAPNRSDVSVAGCALQEAKCLAKILA
jgi:predicted extracellular nuclease